MDAINTGSASEATLGLTAIARHLCLPGGYFIHFFLDLVDGSSQLEDSKYGEFMTSLFEETIANSSVAHPRSTSFTSYHPSGFLCHWASETSSDLVC